MRNRKIATAVLAVGLALSLGLSACGSGGSDSKDVAGPKIDQSAGLDKLVKNAKDDNCLTIYGVPEEATLKTVTDAFTKEYDIPVEFVRLVSADLAQRFSSEATADAPAADLILLTHSPFFADAYSKGWLNPVDEAGIPEYKDFPQKWLRDEGATPAVYLVPSTMTYNTDLVDEKPTKWDDYANEQYKGDLLFAEPKSSPANYAFWSLMRKEYGDEFLQAVAKNEPKFYNSAVPATQAVAAGEGALGFPGVDAIVNALKSKGAPVESAQLLPTTGPEIAVGLSAKSKCPNAAKLFANFVIAKSGNEFLNKVAGGISPYSSDADDFVHAEPVPPADAAKIEELLGAK
jgi:iron(III) transport system substrate-binding protein